MEVRLLRAHEAGEEVLLRTSFLFADVSLKPVGEAGDDGNGDKPVA